MYTGVRTVSDTIIERYLFPERNRVVAAEKNGGWKEQEQGNRAKQRGAERTNGTDEREVKEGEELGG